MGRTSLYRHFDADGRLLYVGVSKSFMSRLAQHEYGSHWYWDIETVKVETHKSRKHALYAEAVAIRDEAPMHNKHIPIPVHPDRVKRRAPAAIVPPSVSIREDIRRIGYLCADRRFIESQMAAMELCRVPAEMVFADVTDEIGEDRPGLRMAAKMAQHVGTEFFYAFAPVVPDDVRAILQGRGVILKCAC